MLGWTLKIELGQWEPILAPTSPNKKKNSPQVGKNHKNWGVELADVVRLSALVVQIAPAGVRVPGVAATKMDVGMTPCTEAAPTSAKTGREWKTSS